MWIYGLFLILAAGLGLFLPAWGSRLEVMISLIIGVLMYGMFTQIPFLELRKAFDNRRFIAALLTVNFLVVPTFVWILVQLLPEFPPLHLGVYLVLLTPCIDYVIVFTHLGRGNEKLVLVSTPLLLFIQLLLLPVYLWLFMGETAAQAVQAGPFIKAFVILIILPLALALATHWWAKNQHLGQRWLNFTAWLPVPFMAFTLFVVVASQIGKLYEYFPLIRQVIPIYIAFMIITPILSRIASWVFQLDIPAGRALIFSVGTRNSLVVLPLAFALPDTWSTLVASVIVTQTLVELIGELIYIRLVPNFILPGG